MKIITAILLLTSIHSSNSAIRSIQSADVLSYSDTSSVLVWSGYNTTSGIASNPRRLYIPGASQAIWIWDSTGGNSSGCHQEIVMIDTFSVKCLNQPLKLHINVDD